MLRERNGWPLRVRLPMLMAVVVALALTLFLTFSYRQVREELAGAGRTRAGSAATQLASLLQQSAQQQMAEASRAAADPAIANVFARRDPDTMAAARKRLSALSSAGQPAAELWDDDGLVVAGTPAASPRPLPELPPPSRPFVTGVGPFRAAGSVIYWRVAADVPGAGAQRRGVVVVRRILSGSGTNTALRRLIGGDDAAVKLGSPDGGTWTDLASAVPPPTGPIRPGMEVTDRASNGEPMLGAAASVARTPWVIVVEFPEAGVVAPARSYLLRMLLITVVLVLLAAAAVYLIMLRLTLPLDRLTRAAEAIAQGRFDVPVDVGRDEVGRLGAAFSSMAGQVHAGRRELEARVEERTRKVVDLNGQLERRVEELKTLTSELESFSYSVSHDLRAPLRHIAGFATLLQQRTPDLEPGSARYLTTIIEAAARMGRLVDDLLNFSRMGRAELLDARVDLNGVVRDVIREVEAAAAGRRIEWSVHPLPTVSGDPAMLRLVFVNLLSNAVKYTAPRQEARIEIGTRPSDGDQPTIYVRDNGVGFDMKYVGKLFGVFQRLHGSDSFEGTGIGLANVRRVVERHGGRAWAEGAVDEGATFSLTLPSYYVPERMCTA